MRAGCGRSARPVRRAGRGNVARRETEAPTGRCCGTRKRSANCYSLTLRQACLSSTLPNSHFGRMNRLLSQTRIRIRLNSPFRRSCAGWTVGFHAPRELRSSPAPVASPEDCGPARSGYKRRQVAHRDTSYFGTVSSVQSLMPLLGDNACAWANESRGLVQSVSTIWRSLCHSEVAHRLSEAA